MKHLMIDIETMGTHTSNSVITAIAALPFDLTEQQPLYKIENALVMGLSIGPQLLRMRVVHDHTQKFWSKQPPEASEIWAGFNVTPVHPGLVHGELARLIEKNGGTAIIEIWANGDRFDIGNLENLIWQHGPHLEVPWAYNHVSDARTIYRWTPKRRETPKEVFEALKAHDPIDDCIKQVWYLWEHWNF